MWPVLENPADWLSVAWEPRFTCPELFPGADNVNTPIGCNKPSFVRAAEIVPAPLRVAPKSLRAGPLPARVPPLRLSGPRLSKPAPLAVSVLEPRERLVSFSTPLPAVNDAPASVPRLISRPEKLPLE